MTIGRVFHRGPVECGPWFTIVKQKSVHDGPGGMIGGGGRGGLGGGWGEGGGWEGGIQRRFKRSLDLSSFKYPCYRGWFFSFPAKLK
jgi:hypothetical protein